jgi:hypothetical protein
VEGNPESLFTFDYPIMGKDMMYWLYEHMLKRQITVLPGHVCFMISGKDMADTPDKLYRATAWCNEISEFVAVDSWSYIPYRNSISR